MFRFAVVAVSTCLVSSSAMAANCSFDHFNFQFGTDTSTHMQVRSGARCGANLNYRGGGPSAIAVSQQPTNGTVSTPTLSHWEYVSRRGYTGADHFVVSVTGEAMGRLVHTGTTQIAVDVDVVP